MQIFLTIISGVSIYVLGQITQTFIMKPIQDLKIVLGEISHKVKFHSNVITNSGIKEQMINWSGGDMRDLSCQLESKYLIIPFNNFFGYLNIIPNRNDIREASKYLILLSNATGKKGFEIKNANTIDKLKKHLGMIL